MARWTSDEDTILLNRYGKDNLDKLSDRLNRSKQSIKIRYEKLQTEIRERPPCPVCGSKTINKVETYSQIYGGGSLVFTAYFCMECLTEFNKFGRVIPPLK